MITIRPHSVDHCRACDSKAFVLDPEGASEDHRRVYKDCDECAGTGVAHCQYAADGCCGRVETLIRFDGRTRLACGDAHCVEMLSRELYRLADRRVA